MTDLAALRQKVEHVLVRVVAGGEADLVANPERMHGPEGFAATAVWLRSCSGTHEGGLPPGMPATHEPFAVRRVHLFRAADDGRLVEHWAVRDDVGLMLQAGLLGPPGGGPPPPA